VARSWAQLLGEADGAPEPEERQAGMFSRLRDSLSKSRRALTEQIQAAAFDPSDELAWERLEEALIQADVGVRATAELVRRLEARGELGDLGEALADEVAALFGEPGVLNVGGAPSVILVVGVNGTGKTTTIGKLAWHLQKTLGQKVLIAAADTFRAAAVEQLERWSERAGCEFVRGPEGSDPGAVAFDAVARGRERGVDVVIVDTAGRLHTQTDLMAELTKVRRVITKQMPDAPHETLMTVDATTGQNGLRQAKLFGEAVDVTGIVLTKLDGTAKGGIALAIANELKIPVKLIGIGESLEDLRPFDADDFSKALLTG
jgi:fused signal recognition particle receptor